MNKGITHVLIVRSTLERRLDPKFPAELKYQIVEVRRQGTEHANPSEKHLSLDRPPVRVVGGRL